MLKHWLFPTCILCVLMQIWVGNGVTCIACKNDFHITDLLTPVSNSSWHSVLSNNLPDVYPCSVAGNDASAFNLSFLALSNLPKYVVLKSEFSLHFVVFIISDCIPSYTSRYSSCNWIAYYQSLILPVLFLLWFEIDICICLLSLCSKYGLLYDACHVWHKSGHCSKLTTVPLASSIALFFQHCWQSILDMDWSLCLCCLFYLTALPVLSHAV